MVTLKCKVCGAPLDVEVHQTIATCKYCDSRQTLPRLANDQTVNLYDRAGHFRRNNDFDKAMAIYEQILNEDITDAEAYWSILLCRYGIEYVEDPATHKRVPTVNRAQFTSIYNDEDYKSAIKYADENQRKIYEEDANTINEIQKGILAISNKEQPFDVFICYKETDEQGRRTRDSVLATELYNELTREGFKVFFARITLEDKLGEAYEPYIFAALNSAKVMVVLGTKPEYFSAVWVKNEWSRYLALIKSGAKKTLIPAYKDMDPYDLPEEFSHLQAQDMSKLGFMQDLIRGIKKITQTEEKSSADNAAAKEPTLTSNFFLKRAFAFIEDGDFESGEEYCEKALMKDAECAEAYLGKLMIELKVKKRRQLAYVNHSFADSNNYKRIIRFGSDELIDEVKEYLAEVTKHEKERQESKKNESTPSSDFDFKVIGNQLSDIKNRVGRTVSSQLSDVQNRINKSATSQSTGTQRAQSSTTQKTPTITIVNSDDGVKYCNKWVALVLCVFYLGFFGAHRFYEGDTKWGIIYLFTFGLFGVGVFFDVFRILLKPTRYPKKTRK